MTDNPRPRVVVVGAGFAGLAVVKRLMRFDVDVVIFDRHNYNTFQPLLYQVATAGLDAGDVAHHIRGIVRDHPRAELLVETVTGIDAAGKRVHLQSGESMSYDALVITTGARTNYFGVDGAHEHALPLYTLPDAIRLRNHVLSCFEEAEAQPSLVDEGALTFVVVGGGATGVETAGAMSELFSKVMRHDFRRIDVRRARVVVVEMADSLLGTFRARSREHARTQLLDRGVELRLGEQVTAVERHRVLLASGHVIPTHTVVWAAGVQASELAGWIGFEQTKGGRITVEPDLSVPGHPDVFVAGDLAAAKGDHGDLLPQVAQVAMQEGHHAARMVMRRIDGEQTRPFRYRDPGSMATIGRRAAVADLPFGITLTGGVAWLAWLFLHLLYIVGFRRRTEVLLRWAWNYTRWEWGPLLILRPSPDPDVSALAPAAEPSAEPTSGAL
ncbi:MAG TPA: NAD(P)/FAD-dependent oxidoreductase [Acidimicrobiia bacterium]|nr:NAD(P)/FAD-dependent oxidoreductase [Acidimicrobiia bacterium]